MLARGKLGLFRLDLKRNLFLNECTQNDRTDNICEFFWVNWH